MQIIKSIQNRIYEIREHDTRLAAIYNAIETLLDEKAAQRKWEGSERIGFTK
jgi:hypothetical protein